jgi:hypothetical protein
VAGVEPARAVRELRVKVFEVIHGEPFFFSVAHRAQAMPRLLFRHRFRGLKLWLGERQAARQRRLVCREVCAGLCRVESSYSFLATATDHDCLARLSQSHGAQSKLCAVTLLSGDFGFDFADFQPCNSLVGELLMQVRVVLTVFCSGVVKQLRLCFPVPACPPSLPSATAAGFLAFMLMDNWRVKLITARSDQHDRRTVPSHDLLADDPPVHCFFDVVGLASDSGRFECVSIPVQICFANFSFFHFLLSPSEFVCVSLSDYRLYGVRIFVNIYFHFF